MKIAFIHQPTGPIWTPGTSGSVSIWVYEVARRIARSCEAIVYARKGESQPDRELYEGVDYRRISVRRDELVLNFFNKVLPFKNRKRPLFASTMGYRGYITWIGRDLQKQKCDIIHIIGFPNFAPVVRSFNPETPIVLHMHGEWLTQVDPLWVERWLSETDFILSVSDFVGEGIKRRFPKYAPRCQTVYMGVDSERFAVERGPSTRRNGAKRLLYVGRISPEKGLHVLLDAFLLVLRRFPDATLKIVGPEWRMPRQYIVDLSGNLKISSLDAFYGGSYLASLKRRVPAEIAHQVEFVDLVVHEKINAYFEHADLYVNPSLSESLGMSIIEAMASELAVVATRVGGVPEVVDEGRTGLLVESDNATALAGAIIDLLENDPLRESMGKAALRRVDELFSWDHISDSLLNKYRNLLTECSGRRPRFVRS